jgi:hypothetical protein
MAKRRRQGAEGEERAEEVEAGSGGRKSPAFKKGGAGEESAEKVYR